MSNKIGQIIGRLSTANFKFLVSGNVRKWDYVQVQHNEVGPVLAQVTEIERQNSESVADCVVIGYRTERGFLRRPRTPLEPGADVFIAEDALITKTLGLTKGGLYLGLLEGKSTIKSYLDPEKLLTKHLAILAKSGAGKSYAVGVLLEELADKGFPVIVIDPHGEYSSIKYKNNHPEDEKYFALYGIEPKGYLDKVKEYSINTLVNPNTTQLKLPIPKTPFEIVESLPLKLSNAQKGLLYSALNELREQRAEFDFSDIVEFVNLSETNAKWGLISAIETLQKTNLFSLKPTEVSELVKPGQLTIINLKGASPDLQETTLSALAIKLFEQRKLGNIPPFFLVVEEAHTFCPERGFGEARSSKIMRAIASEGRKFGLGLCVVSQRPARIDKNVLSQCTSQIVLQVTNPNDLKAISASFEGVRGETESEIKSLPVGKALVIGAADWPTFVDIRVRKSSHGGRAEKIMFESEDEELNELMEKSALAYAFRPRIAKKEVNIIEEKEIADIKPVLAPVLCVNGKRAEKIFYLVFSLLKPQIFFLGEKLEAIDLPMNLAKLSPMQKKVMNVISSSRKTTPAEVMLKANMTFSEAEGVIESLRKAGLIETSGKELFLPNNIRLFVHLDQLSFPEKADYIDLPGEKLKPAVKEKEILEFLRELGYEVTNQRAGWLPCWLVTFKDNSTIIKDALSWNLKF